MKLPTVADLFKKPAAPSVSLDDDCSAFSTPSYSFNQSSAGVFHSGAAFYKELEFASKIDLTTWTCTWPLPHLGKKLNRVLIGAKQRPTVSAKELGLCKSAAYHPSVHAKLYLCYDNHDKLYQAFVGSQNFVEPTMWDLMIRVSKRQLPPLLEYFNRLWERAYALRTAQPKDVRVSDVTNK